MNFLAHAYRFLQDPYFAAGTCVPDWLGMIDRKTRVRKADAIRLGDAGDAAPIASSIARGIVQHLRDDEGFHGAVAFVELSRRFSGEIARCLDGRTAVRAGFLGHVLLELLLDSVVAEQHPTILDSYYRALAKVDAAKLQATVNQLARKPTDKLEPFLPRFLSERLLFDYLKDQPLLHRLNGIARRINLPQLPDALCGVIQAARPEVRARCQELLHDRRDEMQDGQVVLPIVGVAQAPTA